MAGACSALAAAPPISRLLPLGTVPYRSDDLGKLSFVDSNGVRSVNARRKLHQTRNIGEKCEKCGPWPHSSLGCSLSAHGASSCDGGRDRAGG
jgi:hypothetical protein